MDAALHRRRRSSDSPTEEQSPPPSPLSRRTTPRERSFSSGAQPQWRKVKHVCLCLERCVQRALPFVALACMLMFLHTATQIQHLLSANVHNLHTAPACHATHPDASAFSSPMEVQQQAAAAASPSTSLDRPRLPAVVVMENFSVGLLKRFREMSQWQGLVEFVAPDAPRANEAQLILLGVLVQSRGTPLMTLRKLWGELCPGGNATACPDIEVIQLALSSSAAPGSGAVTCSFTIHEDTLLASRIGYRVNGHLSRIEVCLRYEGESEVYPLAAFPSECALIETMLRKKFPQNSGTAQA